jgi:uncharacterized membrane protein
VVGELVIAAITAITLCRSVLLLVVTAFILNLSGILGVVLLAVVGVVCGGKRRKFERKFVGKVEEWAGNV